MAAGPRFHLIAAACEGMGIGYKGALPWRMRKEMAHFARMTKATHDPEKRNAVLMGRKTWESIPEKNRPLAGRVNVILSSQKLNINDDNVYMCNGLDSAIHLLESPPFRDMVETVWVIGGRSVYQAAINSGHCHRIYLTRILMEFECDVFFPQEQMEHFKVIRDENVPNGIQVENGIEYKYEVYEKFIL